MLIVFSGLPGSGKTTVSRALATRIKAVYLRIDAVEQTVRNELTKENVGTAGYGISMAIAEGNLALGISVIADCVNPVLASRSGWRNVAARTEARLIEVEVICSDQLEHRRRVEARTADIPGHLVPSWASVLTQVYEPWEKPHLVIDTAMLSEDAAVNAVLAAAS